MITKITHHWLIFPLVDVLELIEIICSMWVSSRGDIIYMTCVFKAFNQNVFF